MAAERSHSCIMAEAALWQSGMTTVVRGLSDYRGANYRYSGAAAVEIRFSEVRTS